MLIVSEFRCQRSRWWFSLFCTRKNCIFFFDFLYTKKLYFVHEKWHFVLNILYKLLPNVHFFGPNVHQFRSFVHYLCNKLLMRLFTKCCVDSWCISHGMSIERGHWGEHVSPTPTKSYLKKRFKNWVKPVENILPFHSFHLSLSIRVYAA